MKECAVCKQVKETKVYEVEAKTSAGKPTTAKINLCDDCGEGWGKKYVHEVIVP